MVAAIEELYIENAAYRALFETLKSRMPPQAQVESLLQQAKQNPQIRARVLAPLAPLRQRIQEQSDLADVIQEFLRVAPPKKDLN